MMCVDPNRRLSMATVLEHPWLATDHENTSRVDKLLCAPSTIVRNSKRHQDDSCMSTDDIASTTDGSSSSGRNKRAKH